MTDNPQQEVVARICDRLRDGVTVQTKRMFGGVSVMVDGELWVSVGKRGDLLVRVNHERYADLCARDGVSAARMGERDMGPGWLVVDAAHTSNADIDFWLGEASRHGR